MTKKMLKIICRIIEFFGFLLEKRKTLKQLCLQYFRQLKSESNWVHLHWRNINFHLNMFIEWQKKTEHFTEGKSHLRGQMHESIAICIYTVHIEKRQLCPVGVIDLAQLLQQRTFPKWLLLQCYPVYRINF